MKTKEELAEQYAQGKSSSKVFREAHVKDFLEGYKASEPKWISVYDKLPEDDRNLLIKTQDYKRFLGNVTDVNIGYFQNNTWFYENGGVANDGNGWWVVSYMEIPQ